jgi:hypothetical protein
LNNLEFPAHLILILLKFEEQIKNIHEKYSTFLKNNFENDEKVSKSWSTYLTLYEKLGQILMKFKTKIQEEGANIKFTQNSEVKFFINLNFYF